MNKSRRTFLKIILIGGGTFIVGKILGPLFSKFSNGPLARNAQDAFRAINDGRHFSVYDESGEEVLQIDNSDQG